MATKSSTSKAFDEALRYRDEYRKQKGAVKK